MSDRCTGHCCRALVLPHSPEALTGNPTRFQDGEFIADMLIPLAADDPALNLLPHGKPREGWHAYTCRHLQPNGDCGVYAQRPKMCSGYPYGGRCEYKDCTCVTLRTAPIQDGFVVLFRAFDPDAGVETVYRGTSVDEAKAIVNEKAAWIGRFELNQWRDGQFAGSKPLFPDHGEAAEKMQEDPPA